MDKPEPAGQPKPAPRDASLDFNGALSRVALSNHAAREGLALLTRTVPRPRDAHGGAIACSGARKAVNAALEFLAQPVQAAKLRGEQLDALDSGLELELGLSNTGEYVAPRERRLTNFPGWGMGIALGAPAASSAALIVGGLLILWADHKGRAVPFAQAKAVVREGPHCSLTADELRVLLDSDVDAMDTQWPWLAWLQRRWPEIRNALLEGGGPPPAAPSFERRARGQLFARAHYASPARRAGVPTHRDLSKDQYLEACSQVAQWLKADDWRGAYAVATASTGLTIDLAPSMPLASFAVDNWVAVLDPERGTQKADLSHLAEEAAATTDGGGFVPADFTVEKPLPEILARHQRARQARLPNAKTLADLYPEAPRDLAGHMAMVKSDNEITTSWARWTNSSGVYMRQRGMDNYLACIVSGDFGHAPRSKMYYAVVLRSEIWAAAAAYFKQCGWGAPVAEAGGGVAFGSRVVSTSDGLRRASGWLRAEVTPMRPARRDRNTAKLLEFHNRYTRLIAFELALLLGLREGREYEIWADIDEVVDYWVEILDKSVPGPKGALPVALCRRAKAAIHNYRVHCRAVADRLEALGHADSELYQRSRAIEQRERVPLLCMAAGLDEIRPAGSGDAFGILPKALLVAPDAGRKWLENALRHGGLRTGDVDAMLRHEVVGQERSSSTSDFIVLEWAMRVGAAVDADSVAILGLPVAGLARR